MSNPNRNALRLLSVPGLGPRRTIQLVNKFMDLDEIFDASVSDLCQIDGITREIARDILSGDSAGEFIEAQLAIIKKSPFKIITLFDDRYPRQLRKIYDPPVLLFCHGEFQEKDQDAIAIVGTRRSSAYGKAVVENLVKHLVEQGITIVSGFARGIDTFAHRNALKYGGRTIAVLGNGIDRVYPPENRELRNELVENGVYCSEFPFGTIPEAVNFPRRNRIISGLSLGTIVIEAGEKSGALLTAYYAVDQNREVFAIPGRLTDKRSMGCNHLIQKGAKLVRNVDDIIEEINAIRKFPSKPYQLDVDFELEGKEKTAFEYLTKEPIHIDELAEKTAINSFELLSILLNLELKGIVRQMAGKMFIRSL